MSHHPTLLFTGGPILTMSGRGSPTPARAEAVAIAGERILAVGGLEAVRAAAGKDREEIDLGGRTLMPGFVDPHAHPLMLGQLRTWAWVGPDVAPSIDALVAVLRDADERLEPGRPLRAYGYDHRHLAEQRHPTAADLDRVATDREIYVMNASGHGGIVNSYALRLHGITAATADVLGGEIGRNPDGTPNGFLMDAACDLIAGAGGVRVGNHGPNFHLGEDAAALAAHLAAAEDEFLRVGTTTVVDAQCSRREIETWTAARDAGRLRLRVDMLAISSLLEDVVLELGLRGRLGDDRLAFAGIKFYADGTLGGATAYFPDGYAGAPHDHGLLYHSPDEFRHLLARAHAAGLQTGTHAQSPAAIGLVIDAVEAAQAAHPRPDARHAVEHCGLPTDPQIAAMARLGMVPVPQPQHARTFGDGVIRSVGRDLGLRYEPCGLFERAGVPVVLSSDAPVSPPHPLLAVQAAIERRTIHGTPLGWGATEADGAAPALAGAGTTADPVRRTGGTADDVRIPVETALRGVTLTAAWATRREASVGSLEPGKLADLVVLEADPTAVAVDAIGAIGVAETWIGGARVR
jgi:predicted amidohydrolase YtcJ